MQRQAKLDEHYQNGLVALNNGDYERARAHFQYVLQPDPGNSLAAQGLAEAEARLVAETHSYFGRAIAHRNSVPTGPECLYRAELTGGRQQPTQLRALDRDYRAAEVEAMLFDSLYNAGMAFLNRRRSKKESSTWIRPLPYVRWT